MVAIQILSDLHLESPKGYDMFEIVPKAPYLALLGDIGNIVPHTEECLAFLTHQLRQFRVVLFVPGNHEAHGSTWTETLDILKQFEHDVEANEELELGQFVLLDRGIVTLPATTDDEESKPIVILGCSLFSHIPPDREMKVEMGLQDFYQTTSWSARAHTEAHARDLAWLNEQVQLHHGAKVVIFTHWSPSTDPRSMDPRFVDSPITPGFSTDLSDQTCFASGNVTLWAFGHTHYNCDFTMDRKDAGPLRLMTNQRGYYFSQAHGFDEERIVEL